MAVLGRLGKPDMKKPRRGEPAGLFGDSGDWGFLMPLTERFYYRSATSASDDFSLMAL